MFVQINLKELAQSAVEYAGQKEKYSDFVGQLLADAIKKWEVDQYETALNKCNDVINLEPDFLFAYLFKALIFSSQEQFLDSQITMLTVDEKELNKNENEFRLIIRAINCFYTKQYMESLEACHEFILSNKGEDKEIYLLSGLSHAALENHERAIKDFKIALKEKWEVNGIKANLAYSYLRNGNPLKALLLYRKIIQYFPNNWKVQYNTGLAHFKFALFNKALPYLNRTEALKPDFAGTYLTRGFIYLKKRNRVLALKDWEKAKELGEEYKYKVLMRKYYFSYKYR